jgi:hypothetical protein
MQKRCTAEASRMDVSCYATPCPSPVRGLKHTPGTFRPANWNPLSKRICTLGFIALCFASGGAAWGSQGVALAWDPVSTPGVSGYVVYYGTTNNNFTSRVDVGTNTTATITGLTDGQTNYFVVTAYNAAKIEGLPSAQMTFIAPGVMKLVKPSNAGNPMGVTFPVAPGHYYVVQASTDMKTWATIYQTPTVTSNAWVTFQDPQTSSFQKRFYRLALH